MHETIKPKSAYPTVPKAVDTYLDEFNSVAEAVATDDWKNIYSNYMDFDDYELEIIKESDYEIENYSFEQQQDEYIKCANSFAYWCHKYVKIAHPLRALIPFRLFNYQRKTIDAYEKHRFNILSKFRQGGLSTVSVLWCLWRCMFRLDQRILIVSKTDREAIAAGEIAKLALDYMPKWMLPKMGKCNEHERKFEDTGSTLWCYTVEAARSKSITVLVIDEGAFIPDMDKHWAGLYPTLATGGKCCVVSTVNGVGNWYEDTYHRAQSKKNQFHIVDMDYWEHPEYNSPGWEQAMRTNLGEKKWAQEIMRSFLGSGETFFATKTIERLDQETQQTAPARFLFEKYSNTNANRDDEYDGTGALWVWREPVDGREYILSADCAEGVGEEGDNSCFQMIDVNTMEQVCEFYSNTVQPHIFAQMIHRTALYYNNALVVIENMGQGGTVLSQLQHILSYENLYYDPEGKRDVPGMKTGKQNRLSFLEAMQNALTNDLVKINSRRFVSELNTFIYNPKTKKPEAIKGKHDDAIMAMAIAIYIRNSQMRHSPLFGGSEPPKEITRVLKSQSFEEIKREIMSGTDEELWQDENEEVYYTDAEGMMTSAIQIMRKRDKLLKEFGW